MMTFNDADIAKISTFIQAARENLDRIETIIKPVVRDTADALDPSSPLNKNDKFLTERGIEVCYRLFDMGKSRYAVAEALKLSYGAATHRFHAWEKEGGQARKQKPLG